MESKLYFQIHSLSLMTFLLINKFPLVEAGVSQQQILTHKSECRCSYVTMEALVGEWKPETGKGRRPQHGPTKEEVFIHYLSIHNGRGLS